MADVENKDVTSDSLGDATHKEGTDYIKDRLAGKADATTTTEGTAPATGASESVIPETTTTASTTKPEPITPAQPPASNPGADNPSAGIAKDAGGLSSAAHVQSPTATKEKRKSIFGQLTGFLSGGGKKEKEARNASTDNGTSQTASGTAAGVAAGTAATAAGATAVLTDRTKSTVQDTTGIDVGAKGKETADNSATGAETTNTTTTTDDTVAKDTEGTAAKDAEESTKEQTDTSGDASHKPPVPADPTQMENRSAIPVAGGEKLGEKHWGESKIVPENPKPAQEEGAGVASKDGQPSKEVSDNTAKNTGSAEGGPSGSRSPDADDKKKGKFFDKIKSKLNKDKA